MVVGIDCVIVIIVFRIVILVVLVIIKWLFRRVGICSLTRTVAINTGQCATTATTATANTTAAAKIAASGAGTGTVRGSAATIFGHP